MEKTLKVGILRETKNPPDKRVPLTPLQIVAIEELYPYVQFQVQPSNNRCYTNEEYKSLNILLKEDISDCDILMGVKEVDKQTLIPGKMYLFFAHIAKKQPHNQEMFLEMARKKITLIDYEYLKTEKGQRIVAFGRFAGIVGAYNGIRASGLRTRRFTIRPASQCHDLEDMWAGLRLITLLPGLKILITGDGRVAHGAIETLGVLNIARVEPDDFLTKNFNVPVFCHIGPELYTRHKKRQKFSFKHFTRFPEEYESSFLPYTKVTDILIAGHYWDPRSPVFFTKDDMKRADFRITVIADISCDINVPIPSTIRSTTISDPFYGYNPQLNIEEAAFTSQTNITVMAIDNLPGELPRDASLDFGKQLMNNVLDDLFGNIDSSVIENAIILKEGKLTPGFNYLNDYLNGK